MDRAVGRCGDGTFGATTMRCDQRNILGGYFVEATFIAGSSRNFQEIVKAHRFNGSGGRKFHHCVVLTQFTAAARLRWRLRLRNASDRTGTARGSIHFDSTAAADQPSAYATVESKASSARRESSLVCCTMMGSFDSNTEA